MEVVSHTILIILLYFFLKPNHWPLFVFLESTVTFCLAGRAHKSTVVAVYFKV